MRGLSKVTPHDSSLVPPGAIAYNFRPRADGIEQVNFIALKGIIVSAIKLVDCEHVIDANSANLTGSTFQDVGLAESHFKSVTLESASFSDALLAGTTFNEVNFTGASIKNADLTNVSIDTCYYTGMKIEGIDVEELLAVYRASKA